MVVQASRVARELGITPRVAGRVGGTVARAGRRGRGRRLLRRGDRPRRRPRARREHPPRHDRREARDAEARLRPGGHDDGRQRAGRQRRRVVRRRLLARSTRGRAGSRSSPPSSARRYVADDFAYLARTPARAGALALEQAGRTTADVARVEINEAFASVASNSTRMLGVDEEIVNVNGGAVALGHPIGASGGRIVGTLVHELRRSGGGLGLAAICSGGGQGDALLVEV